MSASPYLAASFGVIVRLFVKDFATSSAAIFSETKSTVLPAYKRTPIMFAMVCDLPVPGGPSMTNVLPARAAATAAR